MKDRGMKESGSISSLLAALAVAALSVTQGCAYIQQAREDAPMTAVAEVRHAQTMNPNAGANNRKAVVGLNGTASKNVSDAYAKSFVPKQGGGANDLYLGLKGVGGE